MQSSDADVLKCLGYEVTDFLGKGSYGVVRLAYSKRHQKQVAIKIMHRRLSPHFFVSELLPREIHILKTVEHPHITRVLEIFDELSDGRVFVVMECAKMNLQEKIFDLTRVPIGQAKAWFSQLLSAVEYLHQQDIVHRDLKCRNVLVTADNQIKLADFGLGRFYKGFPQLCRTFYCTAEYAAPEVVTETPYDAKKSDVWSLGVILYNMIIGTLPFRTVTYRGLIEAQKKPVTFPYGIPVDEDCRKFIEFILHVDPSTRPSVTEVANHPWMKIEKDQECETSQTERSPEKSESETSEASSAQIIIHYVDDSIRYDQDDQDGGTGSTSDSSSLEISDLKQTEHVACSSSSSSDGEEVMANSEDVDVVVEEEEEKEEEEEHGCFIPVSAVVKRVASPILRASRNLRERMRKFFKVKSTANNSSSTTKTSSEVSDQSGLGKKEPVVSEKTKKPRFPKFKILQKKKKISVISL
uniref:non-specific serine/threonine protein kinase n=1 Tax=Astyanax mexicanus TaxID=7994 RepID=A0A8B9H1V1_ASTMX